MGADGAIKSPVRLGCADAHDDRDRASLEFDPYFTEQRLADLRQVYGWDDTFNAVRSVVYSHSGLINGNPFVLCRTRKMEMGTKTYYGHKTIYWTTREYGSDGKMKTEHHSQTLTASVTAPYPGYYEKTRLIYGNVAAPTSRSTARRTGLPVAKGRCHTDGTDESCTTRHAISAKATMHDDKRGFRSGVRHQQPQQQPAVCPALHATCPSQYAQVASRR